jgi:hypothetical protein
MIITAIEFSLNGSMLYYYYYYYYYCNSFHSTAVIQIRINIHKLHHIKQYKKTKHNKYKYTYYENTHTL